jgi:hypothetical protein
MFEPTRIGVVVVRLHDPDEHPSLELDVETSMIELVGNDNSL